MAKNKGGFKATPTIVGHVLNTTHRVWLAGVGTFARARSESAKTFESLVKDGEKAQRETRKSLRDSAAQTRETVAKTKAEVRKGMSRLERLTQRGVEGVLHRLGVPTAGDVRELSKRVSALNASMAAVATEKKPASRRTRSTAAA